MAEEIRSIEVTIKVETNKRTIERVVTEARTLSLAADCTSREFARIESELMG